MGFQRSPEKLSKEIDVLQRDVFRAKVHFDIFKGLMEAWPEYNPEIRNSPCFWNFTMQAHIDAVVAGLCRIYDGNRVALQLTRFLEESVKKNPNLFSKAAFEARLKGQAHRDVEGLAKYPRSLNYEQLTKDLWFCSDENPLVKTLRLWRKNIVAHFNYAEAVNQAEPFHKRHPLPFADIQKLIDEAFSIVNSYSSLFRASIHSTEFASKQHTDYLFVLKSLRAHLNAKRLRRENPGSESAAR
jgi:hypothetical protein